MAVVIHILAPALCLRRHAGGLVSEVCELGIAEDESVSASEHFANFFLQSPCPSILPESCFLKPLGLSDTHYMASGLGSEATVFG